MIDLPQAVFRQRDGRKKGVGREGGTPPCCIQSKSTKLAIGLPRHFPIPVVTITISFVSPPVQQFDGAAGLGSDDNTDMTNPASSPETALGFSAEDWLRPTTTERGYPVSRITFLETPV